jgi:hypothetical protein
VTRVPFAELDDYVSGHMGEAESEAFEERLFHAEAQPELQAELLFLDRLTQLTEHIVQLGSLNPGLTRSELDALIARGRRVDLREITPGSFAVAPAAADAELVVQRADLQLFGVKSVDLEIDLPELGHVKTLRDLTVDPEDGAVYACCDATLFRMATEMSERTIYRVVVVRDGRRETIARYEALSGSAPL